MPRSGREASLTAVRYRSLQHFDLERGGGEEGISSRLHGVSPATAFTSQLIPSLASQAELQPRTQPHATPAGTSCCPAVLL